MPVRLSCYPGRKIVTRIFLAAAALSLVAAPAMARDDTRTFTRDGITYTYTSTKVDDTLVLEGSAAPLGGRFRLVVRDGKVTGYAGGVRVVFTVAAVRKALALAAR